MAENEPDQEFAAWLATVNDDINTAFEEHLAMKPAAAKAPPTTDRSSLRSPEAAVPTGEGTRPGPFVARFYRQAASPLYPLPDGLSIGTAARVSQLLGEGTGLEDVSFLTVAEVAGLMRVSKMTVYRMVHAGELTAVRVGRSFRVSARAVREYLADTVESDRSGNNPR